MVLEHCHYVLRQDGGKLQEDLVFSAYISPYGNPLKGPGPISTKILFHKTPALFSWVGWEERLSRVYCLPSCIVTSLPLLPVPIPCPCDQVLKSEPCLSIDILEMVRVVGGPLDLLIKYLYLSLVQLHYIMVSLND